MIAPRLIEILRPTRIRVIGVASVLLVLAAAANVPEFTFVLPFGRIDVHDPPGGEGTLLDKGIANAALVLGVALSWLFAERAARPRWQQALAAALAVDLAAVVLGAFLVAAQASFATGTEEPVGGTLVLGLIGLLILGLPALVFVFFPVITWVVVVRIAAKMLQRPVPRPPTIEPVPPWPQP